MLYPIELRAQRPNSVAEEPTPTGSRSRPPPQARSTALRLGSRSPVRTRLAAVADVLLRSVTLPNGATADVTLAGGRIASVDRAVSDTEPRPGTEVHDLDR